MTSGDRLRHWAKNIENYGDIRNWISQIDFVKELRSLADEIDPTPGAASRTRKTSTGVEAMTSVGRVAPSPALPPQRVKEVIEPDAPELKKKSRQRKK